MEEVIIWLKSSILGIIILGTIGSMFGVIIIYIVTKMIPSILGHGSLHFTNHQKVFDRAFSRRQNNFLITYFMYHLTYILAGGFGGALFCTWAFMLLFKNDFLEAGVVEITILSIGLLFFFSSIYHSFFIERAYKEKLIPLLRESTSD